MNQIESNNNIIGDVCTLIYGIAEYQTELAVRQFGSTVKEKQECFDVWRLPV